MRARVISLANQKGGVGKTTTAVNLAACLAERGKRTLLIDLDPQCNASSGLGVATGAGCSLYGPLLGEDAPVSSKVVQTALTNLDIIPSEIDLAGAEVDMARRDRYLHVLKDVLGPFLASAPYEFAFVDCPPSLGILTMNALAASDSLIVPSQCEYLALEGLSVITRLVRQLRQSGANPALEIEGIVMTMFDGRTNLSAQVVEEVRKHFGPLVYETAIPRNVRLSEAPSFGQPVISYDKHSAGAAAYRALAREFLKRRNAGTAVRPTGAGKRPVLSSRERLSRCFRHQQTDRPGVCVRTGFPGDDPTYDEIKALLREKSDLKVDWNGAKLIAQPQTLRREEPYSEDFKRVIEVLLTPSGELTRTWLASLKGQPGLHETYFLKDRSDAERFLSLPMPEIGGNVDSFFDADTAIGRRGITVVSLGLNPGGQVAELFGSETFAMISVTDRDIVHALCERQMKIALALVRFLLDHKVGPFFGLAGEEYIVPPMHGLADFNDFNARYDKPILDLIHEAGGRVHIHCHGRIKTVFQSFLDIGTDVLHPCEPPPMGDLTAAEAKAMARGRLCIEGNIQIADIYERSPDEIRDQTESLIRDAFDDRSGLIVCPSASPYIRGAGRQCLEQIRAMVDAVINWRPNHAG